MATRIYPRRRVAATRISRAETSPRETSRAQAFVLAGSIIFMLEQGHFSTEHPELCCAKNEDNVLLGRSPCGGCYIRPTHDGYGLEASPFRNIPVSMYWVIVTMTTVGYGDFYPTSTIGRSVTIVVVYAGILAIALPITVIGNNFTRNYEVHRVNTERQRERTQKLRRSRWKSTFRKTANVALADAKLHHPEYAPPASGKVAPETPATPAAATPAAATPPRPSSDLAASIRRLQDVVAAQERGLRDVARELEGLAAAVAKGG